jgi:hypothetical protein
MNTLATFGDAYLIEIVKKIGNLGERLSALENEVKNHVIIAGVILAILGFFGWRQVRRWIRDYVEEKGATITNKVEKDIGALVAERKSALTEVDDKLKAYVEEAARNGAKVREIVARATASAQSSIIWESGTAVRNTG